MKEIYHANVQFYCNDYDGSITATIKLHIDEIYFSHYVLYNQNGDATLL